MDKSVAWTYAPADRRKRLDAVESSAYDIAVNQASLRSDAPAPPAASSLRSSFGHAFASYAASPEGARDAARFEAAVRASDMRFAGEPLEVAFEPFALDPPTLERLRAAVEPTVALLERSTLVFLDDQDMQLEYGWPPERLRVVRHDPGYSSALPCARLDSYWTGRLPQFLEVNTDGTSGMTNVEQVTEIFLEAEGLAPLRRRFGLAPFELRAGVLASLLECYEQWRARHRQRPREPRIGIVDWRDAKTRTEFEAFRRYFVERGLRATIADPRDLVYDGRELSDAGGPIDLVYRRVVSTEYFAHAPEVEPLTQAYLEGAVCVVGSFRSDVAFDKRFIALLTDERFEARIDASDRALAREVFPWTRTLRPGVRVTYEGRERDLLQLAIAARERFVLKPAALYQGRGVVMGAQTGAAEWRAAIQRAADGQHVLQERVEAACAQPGALPALCPTGATGYLSIGEYCFGGKLIGVLARIASSLVLSAASDERLLPAILLGGATASS